MLEWMLLLPAAIPAYIIAYTGTDFFEYDHCNRRYGICLVGKARDYWFPEIRSLGGAMLVMSSVLSISTW